MNSLARFLKYNNAVPLLFGALFLSVGGAFAASPEARDAVFSSEEVVRSIDNSYIVDKDLGSWTPGVLIVGVTEDEENYYVAYDLSTIDVVDYVWRDTTKSQTLTVAKDALGGSDLGLYVTKQLGEVFDRQISYLREVQAIERKNGESLKTVATVYSGLVGKFLDGAEETLPGYQPVIAPPPQENTEGTGGAGQGSQGGSSETPLFSGSAQAAGAAAAVTPSSAPSSGSTSVGAGSDRTAPTIQIIGNKDARIVVGQRYNDLGAIVTDNVDSLIGYTTAVNGVTAPPGEASIDTTKEGKHSIVYTATDAAGNSAYAERTVEVYFDPTFPRPQTGTPAKSDEATSSVETLPES